MSGAGLGVRVYLHGDVIIVEHVVELFREVGGGARALCALRPPKACGASWGLHTCIYIYIYI